MITIKQWKELCNNIREKRLEGKDIYFGNNDHRIVACFAYRDIILLANEMNEKITHKYFKNQSYQTVKSKFYWVEKHNFNERNK